MTVKETESAPQALRELAGWVIRDHVDSEHLGGYMCRLLNEHLVELHASCRYEAMVVARCFAGLGPMEVASELCRRAWELERTPAAYATCPPWGVRHKASPTGAQGRMTNSIQRRSRAGQACGYRFKWFPELIAATVYTAVGVWLLWFDPGDDLLRLTAAGGFGLLGFISAAEAILVTRRDPHQ
jgi:hypothetical protein